MLKNPPHKKITARTILLISLSCFIAWKAIWGILPIGGSSILLFQPIPDYILYFALLFFMWLGKPIPRKLFFCLLILLSIYQMASFISFRNMTGLLTYDDYPKFYSYTVENAAALIKYGSPFGFNHNFQGGIPAFYFRSCFLEFLPFALVFGKQLGFQLMLLFFIGLIPFSFFFLVFEFTKDEDVARLASVISTLQVGTWLLIKYGTLPALIAISLFFLAALFFLRYIYGSNKRSFFYLFFFSSLLAYTHLGYFLGLWTLFAVIFIYKSVAQKNIFTDFKKLAYLALFSFLVCLPLYYNILNYAPIFSFGWRYPQEGQLAHARAALSSMWQALNVNTLLLPSIIYLIHLYYIEKDSRKRIIFCNALVISAVLVYLKPLADILRIQEIRFIGRVVYRITGVFAPYLAVFNLSLLSMLQVSKKAKMVLISALLFIAINTYPSSKLTLLPMINKTSAIDDTINTFIGPQDYVLFENVGHLPYARQGYKDELSERPERDHNLTWLQKDLGAKFFSQTGDDPHTLNKLRQMYIVNGFYDGRPLEGQEKEFTALLKDWGVNKACVWSDPAIKFFDSSKYFKPLGKSRRYTCYAATYGILPAVRPQAGGRGQVIDERPFSFTVRLNNISRKQAVVINKNYFRFWSAYDEKGSRIPLRRCGQKICFDAAGNGLVFFKYSRNILLNITALLTLLFALALHLKSSYEAHRTDSRV